jgi:hypothetical protein
MLERVHRRNELRERRKEDADKKKKDSSKGPSKSELFIKYAQMAAILYFTAPLAVLVQHLINQILQQAIK